MNKLLILLLICAFALTSCNATKQTKSNSSVASDSHTTTEEPKILFAQPEPLLLAGETANDKWAYVYMDIDDNDIAERISFTNITKTNEKHPRTFSRLAIEFDCAGESTTKKEPVLMELNSGANTHPEITCSKFDDCTLIFIKDPYAAHGEELYPFKYTTDKKLEALNTNTYPNNGFCSSGILALDYVRVMKSGNGEMRVILDNQSYPFNPMSKSYDMLCSEYTFESDGQTRIINFDSESKLIVYGESGVLNSNESSSILLNSIPVQIMITLEYAANKFIVNSVSFSTRN